MDLLICIWCMVNMVLCGYYYETTKYKINLALAIVFGVVLALEIGSLK